MADKALTATPARDPAAAEGPAARVLRRFLRRRGAVLGLLVIKAVAQAEFVAVDVLPASERGLGGFGHSGR